MRKQVTSSIDLRQVDQCLGNTLLLLRQTYTSLPNGLGGWYHQLSARNPGPTATALGLSAFIECGQTFEHFEDGLRFLASRQLKSPEPRLRGGWALNTSMGRPVVEATGWVVKFLASARCTQLKSSPDVELGYQWLLNNQNDDNGWGSLYGSPSRVWLTCVALRGLAHVDPYGGAVERGLEWLMGQQDREPSGWGEVKGRQVTATHTAMALLTLAEMRPGWTDSRLAGAYDWLAEHLDTTSIDDQNARVESYNVEAEPSSARLQWHTILLHYGLPIAMSALVRKSQALPGRVISSGYATILRTQQAAGAWRNIQGGNDPSIWALWPFVQALVDLRTLPVSRVGGSMLWAQDVLVVQSSNGRHDALSQLVRTQRRRSVLRFFARYWSTVLVMLSVLGGLVLVSANSLEMKDYLLGLIVPLALFIMQEIRNRRRQASA